MRHPSGTAAWTRLLEEYDPGAFHAASLGGLLRRIGLTEESGQSRPDSRRSVLVLSLAADAALALGPQLAAFAASLRIPTALVVAPQQELKVTASLRAACQIGPDTWSGRSGYLQANAMQDGEGHWPGGALLTVVVCVVSGHAPQVTDIMPTTTTMLAVSAGAATREELGRVAYRCAAEGRWLAGVVVADPDSADHTTGRAAQPAGSADRVQPTRVT